MAHSIHLWTSSMTLTRGRWIYGQPIKTDVSSVGCQGTVDTSAGRLRNCNRLAHLVPTTVAGAVPGIRTMSAGAGGQSITDSASLVMSSLTTGNPQPRAHRTHACKYNKCNQIVQMITCCAMGFNNPCSYTRKHTFVLSSCIRSCQTNPPD